MKQQDTAATPTLERPARSAAAAVGTATPAHAPSPAAGPAIKAAAPQQPLVSSKLMQNYCLEAPVSAAGEVQAVLDGAGNLAVFTTGTSNRIYVNRYAPGSQTGWVQTDTGLQAPQFAAALDANGRLVVAVPLATNVTFVEENADGTWGSPQIVGVAALGTMLSAVQFKRLKDGLWVVAIGGPPGGAPYAFAGLWQGAQTQLIMGPDVPVVSCAMGWNSALGGAGLFIATQGNRLFFVAASGAQKGIVLTTASALRLFSLAVAEDANGESQVCALLGDGDNYVQPYVLDYSSGTWTCLDPGRLQALASAACATVNAAGLVEVFTVAADTQGANPSLYHVRQDPGAAAGPENAAGWDVPTMLMPGALVGKHITSAMHVCRDGDGVPNLFTITADGLLFRIDQEVSGDADTTLWDAAEIEQSSTNTLDEIQTYSTEITVLDASGVVKPNADVRLWAEDPVLATVAGQTWLLDPDRALSCKANAAGKVTVVVPTSSLHTPQLMIWVDGMDENAQYWIEPNQAIQDRLHGVTVQQLTDAADMDGNPIVPDTYRCDQWLKPLSQALGNAMSVLPPKSAVRYSAPGAGGFPARIDPARVPQQSWQFDLTSGVPVFRELSADEAQKEVARLRASHAGDANLPSWLNDFGDLMNEAINGAAQILNNYVTPVVNGVQVAIEFTIGAVTYLFEATITLAEEAFGLVESLFKVVQVAFDELFKWLGALFNWAKMQRTHKAVKHVIQCVGLPFLQGALSALQSQVEKDLQSLGPQIENGLDAAVRALGGQTASFLSASQSVSLPADYKGVFSNNIVLDAFMSNYDRIAAAPTGDRPRAADDPTIAALATQFDDLATAFQNGSGYTDLVSSFSGLLTNADGVVQAQLGQVLGALKDPAGIAVAQMQGIVAQIFGLIQQAITTMNKEVLDEPWDIPLLSELYAQYVGDSLTPLSMMALAIALPADAVYFTAFDRHPFETDDDLTTFQKEFTAEWLLQQSQLVPPGTALPTAMPPELRLAVSKFLGTTLAASYVTLGVMNEALDLIAATPANQGPKGPLSSFQAAAVLAGWTRWASAVPWGINPNNNAGCSDSAGAQEFGNLAWILNMMGPLTSTVLYLGRIPGDAGAVTLSVIGLIQVALAGRATALDPTGDQRPHAEAILSFIPTALKFLRLKPVMALTEDVSLAALVATDALCLSTSGGLRAWQTVSPAGARTM
jgi:hypothetical protein